MTKEEALFFTESLWVERGTFLTQGDGPVTDRGLDSRFILFILPSAPAFVAE